jgi:hypothetical protein
MEREPEAKVEVEKLACPAPLSDAVPRTVAPSRNVTVPVGVPDAADVTVVVNVTDWPKVEGLRDETTVVVDGAGLTLWLWIAEVEPLKLASDPYTAVIECGPGVSAEVESVACPPASATAPSEVAPSKKVTVPVGVPEPGAVTATVAVRVTELPKLVGFGADVTVVVLELLLTVWATFPLEAAWLALPL